MQALLLNSGRGERMGEYTQSRPKCLVEVDRDETILGRQVASLLEYSIDEILITTGPFAREIETYLETTFQGRFSYIYNPLYTSTNYIYSLYLARDKIEDTLLLLHGDLVFDASLLKSTIESKRPNTVLVHNHQNLPQKDFKARIRDGLVKEIGVHLFYEDCLPLQPLYKISLDLWKAWSQNIENFIARDDVEAYGEDALNPILSKKTLYPLYYHDVFCAEVDTIEDLEYVRASL